MIWLKGASSLMKWREGTSHLHKPVDFWSRLLGALVGGGLAALAYFLLLERSTFADTLFLREVIPSSFERRLIELALLGKSVALLVPGALVFAVIDARSRRRLSRTVLLSLQFLAFLFLVTDLHLYRLHGRHLLDIIMFVSLPEGHQAGGSIGVWSMRLMAWAAKALALSMLALGVTLLASRAFAKIQTSAIRAGLAMFTLAVFVLAAPLALGAGAGWRTAGLQERLRGVLPYSFQTRQSFGSRHTNSPLLRQLESAFNEVYRRRFGHLFRRRDSVHHERHRPERRPNIFIVVVESLRADALTAEYMPKMFAWAQQGLRRDYHLSGTNFSESGMFSIMYGLNPLGYHAVLDSQVPPPLCEGLRALSYRCMYFTGHPTVWWRREEFLGPNTMDVHERFQQGPWSRWDELALERVRELASQSPASGVLALTFLMSTHYEYRYPPEFERFVPAAEPAVTWAAADVKHDFEQLRNRYRNAIGFVDHLVYESLAAVDTTRDYVLFTGDHGEAIGEHGRVGHGYDFSDTQVHVPLVLRGPGIEPGVVGGMSLHQDIWPTLAAIIQENGRAENDLRTESKRNGALLSHCEFDQTEAEALLVYQDLRVDLRLDLRSPEIRVNGFEDELGSPVPTPALTEEERSSLAGAFDRYLAEAARPITVVR